jgi:hypothetical protein
MPASCNTHPLHRVPRVYITTEAIPFFHLDSRSSRFSAFRVALSILGSIPYAIEPVRGLSENICSLQLIPEHGVLRHARDLGLF